VARRSITRRQALQAGAFAAVAGVLRPSVPALAARPDSLFELDLSRAFAGKASAASADGWRTTGVLRAPRRFDLMGLRWARGSHAEAQVRARRRGGRWTRWVTLHPAGDHGPDGGRPVPGTDPAFMGAADEFQLRVRGNPRNLRARFVRALPTANLAHRLARRAKRRRGAHAAQVGAPPAIIYRPEWGADAVPPREPPLYGAVQLAFVHHTVTANEYGPEDSAGIVLGIARYHRDSNGWNDIGYNFLVDKYGQIFEGRAGGIDQPVVGAQAQGWNSQSTGVSCIGTFSTIAQTPEGLDALGRLIGWKLSVHSVPTEGAITVTSAGGETNRYPSGTPVTFQRISGHRDGNNTSCPGDALYAQLATIRSLATQYAGTGLGVVVPREIRGIRPTEVSGFLRFPDNTSAAGLTIALEFATPDAYWEPLGTTVTASDGSWQTTVEFQASGRVRAVFPGDAAHGRIESAPRNVTVLPKMAVQLGRRNVRLGTSVQAKGTAVPADTVRLTLDRRVRRHWVRERNRVLVVRKGAFQVRLRPRARGRYRLMVQKGRVKRRRAMRVF
jgi:hypothetical protein